MTIHGSGSPIYMSEIRDEFGGWEWGTPVWLSWYYAGGSWVPAGTTGEWGAIPTGGYISLGHFYGASKRMIITFGDGGNNWKGFVEGSFGSLVPQAGGPGYPFGGERVIMFSFMPGSPNRVYLDVAGSWPKNQFNNVDMPGIAGYNSASANVYSVQGGYTRWAWQTNTNPFNPTGATSQVNFT